jgi:hypothetical protein
MALHKNCLNKSFMVHQSLKLYNTAKETDQFLLENKRRNSSHILFMDNFNTKIFTVLILAGICSASTLSQALY